MARGSGGGERNSLYQQPGHLLKLQLFAFPHVAPGCAAARRRARGAGQAILRRRLVSPAAWRVTDGNEIRQVATVQDLEAALDALHNGARERHRLVSIASPAGARLLIGLGGEESVLQFTNGDDPPYFASAGSSADHGVVPFLYEGEETEVERRRLIPMEDARHAASLFFETGVRPENVAWEEV
jgi:immunity protein Imm1 of predicted polymorphic toxin system